MEPHKSNELIMIAFNALQVSKGLYCNVYLCWYMRVIKK